MSNPYFRALVAGVVVGLAIQLVGTSLITLLAQFVSQTDPLASEGGLFQALDTASTIVAVLAGLPVIATLLITWGRQGRPDAAAG